MIHRSFRELGGAERVALVTMEALSEMGFRVILVSLDKPDADAINQLYGMDFRADSITSISPPPMTPGSWPIRLRALSGLPSFKASVIVNTFSDIPPPYSIFTVPYASLSGVPLVLYTHARVCSVNLQPTLPHASMYGENQDDKRALRRVYFTAYHLLVGRAFKALEKHAFVRGVVLANSEFTKRAIKSSHPEVEPIVVPPPVDVKTFASTLSSAVREDRVIVVSRIDPGKQLEEAIELARLLPKHIRCTIVGSLMRSTPATRYYEDLSEMIERYGLKAKVEIKTNVGSSELLQLMARSKVHFHAKRGEEFGISVVEAMAAGLVPIVPSYGGPTEFVPMQYQYRTLSQASELVTSFIDAPQTERSELSNMAERFSEERFKSRMKRVVKRLQR